MGLPGLPSFNASGPFTQVTSVTWTLVALALATLLFLPGWWRGGAAGRRLRAQSARALRGEERAESLLVNAGWEVVGRQVSRRFELRVDGAPSTVLVRADYIVRRGDRRYVAEVKTGRLAPRIETSATRRQLLEYRIAFAVDGVLLVDAESDRISFVEFPLLAARGPAWSPVWWVVSGSLLAAIAAIVWR